MGVDQCWRSYMSLALMCMVNGMSHVRLVQHTKMQTHPRELV